MVRFFFLTLCCQLHCRAHNGRDEAESGTGEGEVGV